MAPQPTASDLHVLRLVAHELRAHLTVLNGYSALLVEDPKVRRDPGRVEHALHEMRTHIDTLNDISQHLAAAVGGRRRRARLPLQMEEVDLVATAREAVAMAGEVARRRDVRLSVEHGALPSGTVRGDRFQLAMALRNLIDNACCHGPAGGEVTVELRGEGDEVEMRVRDQGAGLGDLGDSAFEPLRRGSRPGADGLGLGLSLVAEVARAHGGRSTWGRGARGAWIGMRIPRRRRTRRAAQPGRERAGGRVGEAHPQRL